MTRRNLAFTLTDIIICLAIVAVVAAIATPVFLSVKSNMRITHAVSRVRQLYVGLASYRIDHDGVDGGYYNENAFYTLGLPPSSTHPFFGYSRSFWQSPCGADKTIAETSLNFVIGEITLVCKFYDPKLLVKGSGNYTDYRDYVSQYQDHIVVLRDPYCNPPGTSMRNPFTKKRGIAALLNGTIVNRIKEGNGWRLQFYSDPPH